MRYWLNWSELTGKPQVNIDDFRTALRSFPRSAILIACARFSIIFDFGPDANTLASQERTEYWAARLFRPDLAPRALAFAKLKRPMFFQGQVRFLASEAMRLDPAPAEDGTIVPDWAFGELLLAAGELLRKDRAPGAEEGLDTMADIIANFLPTYEIDTVTDAFILFLRFHIYLTIIIPRLPASKRVFDVPLEFEKVFGFPLDLYTKFVNAFTIHAMNERVTLKVGDVPEAGMAISYFKRTILTDEQVSKMFDTVCCRISDLPDTKKVHGFADFEFLKNHPYLRVDDKLYALDYEYAIAKLESGVLWRVAGKMPTKRRLGYFGFWGDVFEEYVNWLFEVYADQTKNRCHPDPHYLLDRDNRPICDLIVICDSTAVLIEVKSATCAVSVRYSGDRHLIREFLDERLVDGTDRPVGVSQLITAIAQITTKPKDELPVWLRDIRKIIPVIITKDDIGSSWMTNGYLNARFQEKRRGRRDKKVKITPLVSMNIGSLERGCAALQEMAFSDIMEDRIREDPNLGRPFEAASSFVPRGTPRKIHKHVEIMKVLGEEMRIDFGMTEEVV
jgi:hypothetical protein